MGRPSWLRRCIARHRELPLVAEALLALVHARWQLKRKPFRRVVEELPNTSRSSPAGEEALAVAYRAAWAVRAAARLLPWAAVCFDRGLAVYFLLARRGIPARLHFGVARGEGGALPAHVWVSVAGEVVMGGEAMAGVTPLASFP